LAALTANIRVSQSFNEVSTMKNLNLKRLLQRAFSKLIPFFKNKMIENRLSLSFPPLQPFQQN
jgi:hypothetical protein